MLAFGRSFTVGLDLALHSLKARADLRLAFTVG